MVNSSMCNSFEGSLVKVRSDNLLVYNRCPKALGSQHSSALPENNSLPHLSKMAYVVRVGSELDMQ